MRAIRLDRLSVPVVATALLGPSVASAQAAAGGETGTPLLWLWALVLVLLIAAMVFLLFAVPRRRTRAHAMERARRELHGRT